MKVKSRLTHSLKTPLHFRALQALTTLNWILFFVSERFLLQTIHYYFIKFFFYSFQWFRRWQIIAVKKKKKKIYLIIVDIWQWYVISINECNVMWWWISSRIANTYTRTLTNNEWIIMKSIVNFKLNNRNERCQLKLDYITEI